MIRVTIWYEYAQESGQLRREFVREGISEEEFAGFSAALRRDAERIRAVYPKGMMETLRDALQREPEMEVNLSGLYEPECGLSDAILDQTDVLIWWSHIFQDAVPDALARKVVERVQRGMGFICLHSGHKSKPFMWLLGSSGTLKWREGDFCRVWTLSPAHPIAAGIPEHFELEDEEMYGEPFDIAKPDDLIFASWFAGGELFRAGCTWTRGYGRIFYFQPGHETCPSYHNPHVQRILANAVRWAAPTLWREHMDCPNSVEPPEGKRARRL